MVFLLPISVLFRRPSTLFKVVGGIGGGGGGEELKWHQLTYYQLMSPQGPHFSPHSTAKTNDKSKNLRKNGIYWYKWCCDLFSILGENPSDEFDDDDDD